YYHFFYVQQPDLNWRNPAVEKAMFDVPLFWYKRGVAGFRLDAVSTLFEDTKLHDNPTLPGTNAFGLPKMVDKYNNNLPQVHDVLRKLRVEADQHNAVLIGETWTRNIAGLKEYYGPHNDELQMPMDFMFTMVNKLSPPDFRKQIALVESTGGWPVYVFSNHDIHRAYDRYGDGRHNDQIAKLLAGFYLTLRGTPIMYYGEEIGMRNNDPTRRDDVKDPIGRRGWPKEKGRDGERTPMQWNDAVNAGFSAAKPWLPVPDSYRTHNVASELKDPNSILNFYKHVLALHHKNPQLREGKDMALNQNDNNVLSYLRSYQGKAVLVVLNMSETAQKPSFNLGVQGFAHPRVSTLLASEAKLLPGGNQVQTELQPFGVYIGEVTAAK
ncbi:MAG TPA: alpha-amylase family glycosyl hydrolase, partial [Terriglobales bacterium]|nr:alpha-amylase family glycosyl hydrolase [Terriglobales bacterium]